MQSIERLVNNSRFQWFIIGLILFNAIILGLMTLPLPLQVIELLALLDNICLAIFTFEIAMKLLVFRLSFFRDGWSIFDLIVIGIALLPATGGLSVLRALRVLRLLRLATAVPSMRRVINGMFIAIPGGASVAGVLFIMYYVAAIIGVTLFSDTVPEHFGTLGTTFFTLFKMMTLEGWPDIATVVMAKHPDAWIFFVVFIIFTTFTTLNLLFGIVVDAMEKAKEEDVRQAMADQGMVDTEVPTEIRLAIIEDEVKHIRAMLTELSARSKSPVAGE